MSVRTRCGPRRGGRKDKPTSIGTGPSTSIFASGPTSCGSKVEVSKAEPTKTGIKRASSRRGSVHLRLDPGGGAAPWSYVPAVGSVALTCARAQHFRRPCCRRERQHACVQGSLLRLHADRDRSDDAAGTAGCRGQTRSIFA